MDSVSIPVQGCNCPFCERARANAKPALFPFESEPAKAASEPQYTHVLLDYDSDGPLEGYAELHTAASLLEAIESRKDCPERYQVFKLGELILDVSE
jgi:hypothetical protein